MVTRPIHGILVLLSLAAVPPPAFGWETAVPDTPGASRPFAIAVDADGDVVAVGRAVVTASNDDGVIAKVSGRDGALRWQHTLAGSAAGSDLLRSVVTDAARAVIAGGQVVNNGTRGDLLVTKHDADGNQVFRVEMDGGAAREDGALDVVVDGAGYPVVAAQMTPAGATTTRFTVFRLAAADGATLQRIELAGDAGSARALVIDGEDAVAAGDAGSALVAACIAVDSGTVIWRADVTGATSGSPVGRALAKGGGRAVVAGHLPSADGQSFAVIALGAHTGAELWRYVLDGTATGTADIDDAFDVAVDDAGDVIAAGRLGSTSTGDDAVIVKLAGGTGAELWRTTINGGAGNDDLAQAIALDVTGDLFVTGTIRNRTTRADVLLARLAGTNGAETWRQTLNGSEDGNDGGFAVARTGDGHVIAGARVRNGSAMGAFVVVKRTGANGGDFPCGDGTTDPGEQCDDGNVTPGDGCRADCTVEACGDGILDPQEGCDDGNLVAGDCCSPTCTSEPEGTPCDDGNACTRGDQCQHGVCTSVPACEPTDPCDRATCDPVAGTCSHARRAEGSPCDDGDVCTLIDQCIGGTCSGRGSPDCRDEDPCTADACTSGVGCTHAPVAGTESLTCLFERGTIAAGCPGGVPAPIGLRIARARQLAVAADATDRPRKRRRALIGAKKSLKKAVRVLATRKRRGLVEPGCAVVLEQALAELLARTDALRAPPGH